MSKIINVDDAAFNSKVLNSEVPVLAYFTAPWVNECSLLSPVLEELAQEYCGKIRVGKINIDEQPTLALLHRVVSIPTVSIYSEGKEVKRLIGLRDKPELIEAIQEVLKK